MIHFPLTEAQFVITWKMHLFGGHCLGKLFFD